MNEAAAQRKRGRMMLPAPQVSDAELEQLARAGEHAVAMDADIAGGAGAGAACGASTRRVDNCFCHGRTPVGQGCVLQGAVVRRAGVLTGEA